MPEAKKYPMGLSSWDFVKVAGKFSLVFIGAVSLGVMIFLILGAIMGIEFFCVFMFFGLIFIPASIFGALLMMLLFSFKASIFHKYPNYTEISGPNIIFNNTWTGLYPTTQNVIPLFLIRKIERPNENYFKERSKKTHWFFKINTFTHRPPHGGLYVPQTSKKNLLILYLSEPVPISNTNFLPVKPPMMKISEEFVGEIIVDIDRTYQDDFINEILMRNRVMRY